MGLRRQGKGAKSGKAAGHVKKQPEISKKSVFFCKRKIVAVVALAAHCSVREHEFARRDNALAAHKTSAVAYRRLWLRGWNGDLRRGGFRWRQGLGLGVVLRGVGVDGDGCFVVGGLLKFVEGDGGPCVGFEACDCGGGPA